MMDSLFLALWLSWEWLAGACTILALLLLWGWRRHGLTAAARLLIAAVFAGLLLFPSLMHRDRTRLPDMVLAVVDESASARLKERPAQAQAALESLQEDAHRRGLVLRVVRYRGDGAKGTALRTFAEQQAAALLPAGQRAGVVLLTDGRWHDAVESFPVLDTMPVSTVLLGSDKDSDRQVRLETERSFGSVGKTVTVMLTASDTSKPADATLNVMMDYGSQHHPINVPQNTPTPVNITLLHPGENTVVARLPAREGELSPANNRQALNINGLRERLRVLLISGAPNPGTRTWRALFNSDPAVDMVHFTILRPPEKNDFTPREQLALIPFPAEQLFVERLDKFDLIVFDDYRLRNILAPGYVMNMVEHVQRGGALLFSGGMDGEDLAMSPLADLLPLLPEGKETLFPESPVVRTTLGGFHPVTAGLSAPWGKWQNILRGKPMAGGQTLMETPDSLPLLVLRRLDEKSDSGRVAQLLTNRAWLWERQYQEGGPYTELMRRTVNWLLRHPDLDETRRNVTFQADGSVRVQRLILRGNTPVSLLLPDDSRQPVDFRPAEKSSALETATLPALPDGISLLDDGRTVEPVSSPSWHPLEFQYLTRNRMTADAVAGKTDGQVLLASETPKPVFGKGGIPFRPQYATQIAGQHLKPVLPFNAWIALLGMVVLWAWRRESR